MKKILYLIPAIMMFTSCKAKLLTSEGDTCKVEFDTLLKHSVYTQVDVQPSFAQKKDELLRYFTERLKMVDEEDFQDKINLVFVIDTSGKVVGARIKNKNKSSLSKVEHEAIKAAEQMPNWTVGRCNGKAVPVRVSVPIYF